MNNVDVFSASGWRLKHSEVLSIEEKLARALLALGVRSSDVCRELSKGGRFSYLMVGPAHYLKRENEIGFILVRNHRVQVARM